MKVNEIFYSIQGEGAHTGTPALFIRFAGCNLKCPFCDTDHQSGTEMTEGDIIGQVANVPAKLVVITGGEPGLQLTESLVSKLHMMGKTVAVETNGTKDLPKNVDWITISPKHPFVGAVGTPVLTKCNELKLVFDGRVQPWWYLIEADHYYLQPCDTGDKEKNQQIIEELITFVKQNPTWKISLQTQKLLNVR